MAARLTGAIRRLIPSPTAHDTVHFHIGPDGRPRVCDRSRCDSPGLSPADLGG